MEADNECIASNREKSNNLIFYMVSQSPIDKVENSAYILSNKLGSNHPILFSLYDTSVLCR